MHPSSSTSLNALAYSSNCGLLLDITNARSLLMDQFWAKAQNYAIALAVVAALQVYLLVQQMESTSTPSVRSDRLLGVHLLTFERRRFSESPTARSRCRSAWTLTLSCAYFSLYEATLTPRRSRTLLSAS